MLSLLSMGINKVLLSGSGLLFIMANLGFQSKKFVGCAVTVYNFEIGVKAYPDQDSINIGDTIWLEVRTSDILPDKGSGAFINYSGTENLGSAISFLKLKNDIFSTKAVTKFNRVLINGKEVVNNTDPELVKEYLFDDNNGYYQFKLGIIPLETGTYVVVFSNAANVYRTSDKCTKASFTVNFTQTNQHYYLNPNYQGGPVPVGGDYYFKVK